MFYLILFLLLIAVASLMFLASRGEGGKYAEKDYSKKKNNPFDNFMI